MLPEALDRLLAVLFPKTCGFCGAVVEYEDYWCGKCELPRLKQEGVPNALEIVEGIAGIISPLAYESGAKTAVLALKTRPDARVLSFLGEQMYNAYTKQLKSPADLIVPVPQSNSKQQETGYNHAALLAQEMSFRAALPMRDDLLCRRDKSLEQHQLDHRQRMDNALWSYCATGIRLAGERVLLVDDVMTTGATASACACKLLESGACQVLVLTAVAVQKAEDSPSKIVKNV